MDEDAIKALLDTLTNFQAQKTVYMLNKQDLIDKINAEKQARLDEVYTPEIRAEVASIEREYEAKISDIADEFADSTAAVDANMQELEAKIREAVIALGASVKGSFLHAVYTKPRVTWETDKMEGFAVAHPELLALRKEGKPSVSIRDVK